TESLRCRLQGRHCLASAWVGVASRCNDACVGEGGKSIYHSLHRCCRIFVCCGCGMIGKQDRRASTLDADMPLISLTIVGLNTLKGLQTGCADIVHPSRIFAELDHALSMFLCAGQMQPCQFRDRVANAVVERTSG